MENMLCAKPHFNCFIKTVIRTDIKPFSLKSDVDSVTPVFCFIDTSKPTLIIVSVLSLFKNLYTGTVNMVQFFADFLLIFQIQTAAAAVISMYQMCLRYILSLIHI